MRSTQVITLVVLLVVLADVCRADIITVGKNGWEDFDNIQDAINYSSNGDIVEVQPGTYAEKIYFNNRAITLTGLNPNNPTVIEATIISAGDDYSVTFNFGEGNDSILTGFTITGRGIACLATSPTITKNIIRDCDNRAIEGDYDAEPVITDNIIKNNNGGISGCHGLIGHNTITGNQTMYGGGLYYCDGTVSYNTISGNSAIAHGGGLYYCDGTVSHNTISENTANADGGGLYYCDGSIRNNTITGNSADDDGGGLYLCNGNISGNNIMENTADSGGGLYYCSNGDISNNNIIDNTAYFYGGGMYSCNGNINNNTIAGNMAYIYGGGLFDCDGAINSNIITRNYTTNDGGGLCSCDGAISHNIISGNSAVHDGGALCGCNGTINENTVTGNMADLGGGLNNCLADIKNNIIAFNDASSGGGIYGTCDHSYNIFWGNTGNHFDGGAYAKVGDFVANPCFDQDGFWDPNGTPANINDDFWVEGDYHLKSEEGRWDPNMNTWVKDNVTSPAIDAGDPADSVGAEPQPNGGRINMGAYGGTAEAGKTPGTGITLPGPVVNFAIQGGHKKILLRWEEPTDTGGLPVATYKIYRGPGIGALVYYDEVGNGIFFFIDTVVQNGVDYFYSVSALTDAGEGPQTIDHYVAHWNEFDFNKDGIINLIDFSMFCNVWLWKADWCIH